MSAYGTERPLNIRSLTAIYRLDFSLFSYLKCVIHFIVPQIPNSAFKLCMSKQQLPNPHVYSESPSARNTLCLPMNRLPLRPCVAGYRYFLSALVTTLQIDGFLVYTACHHFSIITKSNDQDTKTEHSWQTPSAI